MCAYDIIFLAIFLAIWFLILIFVLPRLSKHT